MYDGQLCRECAPPLSHRISGQIKANTCAEHKEDDSSAVNSVPRHFLRQEKIRWEGINSHKNWVHFFSPEAFWMIVSDHCSNVGICSINKIQCKNLSKNDLTWSCPVKKQFGISWKLQPFLMFQILWYRQINFQIKIATNEVCTIGYNQKICQL